MTQATYNSLFTGQFTPANDNGTWLKGKTVAPQGSLVTERGRKKGLREDLGAAEVRSTVIYTGKSTFQQYGVITFENGRDTLHFSTKGQGQIVEDADKGVKLGSAVLRINYGHGRFEGASGLITSNFVVNDNGEVTASQVGMVEVR